MPSISQQSATFSLVFVVAAGACGGAPPNHSGPDYQPEAAPSVPKGAGWTPEPKLECASGEVACRGACLREVGEVKNTCELLLGVEANLQELQRSGAFLVANSLRGDEIVRISLKDLEITTIADQPQQGRELLVADGLAFFEAGGALNRVPVAGGKVVRLLDSPAGDTGPARFTVADGYVYAFGKASKAVTRAPVGGGKQEEVISEPGIPWFAATQDHYVFVGGVSDQGPYYVPRDKPSTREVLELTDDARSYGVYASLHTWAAEPGYVYALSGRGYARIDAETGSVERLIETDLFYLEPTQTSEHLAVFFRNDEGEPQLRVADRATGHVEVIDQEPFDGIAEDEAFYYVTRDGALVRFPK